MNKAIVIGIIIAIAIGAAFVLTQTDNEPEITGEEEFVDEAPKQFSINLSESLSVDAKP